MAPRAGFWLVAIILTAGCVSGSSSEVSNAPPTKISVGPDGSSAGGNTSTGAAGSGRILGVVLDQDLFPIAGVLVQVASKTNLAGALSLSTSDGGAFEVSGIAPGEYLVQAVKEGYHPIEPKGITVTEAGPTKVRIILNQIVVYEPFVDTKFNRAFHPTNVCVTVLLAVCPLQCAVVYCPGLANPINQTVTHKVNQTASGPLMGVLSESRWTQAYNVAQCNPRYYSGVQAPAGNKAMYYWNNLSLSPLTVWVPRDGEHPNAITNPDREEANGKPIKLDGEWYLYQYPWRYDYQASPVGVSCNFDSTVESYYTFFFGAPRPNDAWTAFQ